MGLVCVPVFSRLDSSGAGRGQISGLGVRGRTEGGRTEGKGGKRWG